MKEPTPQLKAIITELVEICCDNMQAETSLDEKRVQQLVEALKVNGWERHSADQPPLATQLEQRTMAECADDAMHHTERVKAAAEAIGRMYQQAAKNVVVPDQTQSAAEDNDLQASPPRSTS